MSSWGTKPAECTSHDGCGRDDSSAATRGEVTTTMDEEKTLRDMIVEMARARWPEASRSSMDPQITCPTIDDLTPMCESTEAARRLLVRHALHIDAMRDEVSALRDEVAALRTPSPRWRTVAAAALEDFAAVLRGSK